MRKNALILVIISFIGMFSVPFFANAQSNLTPEQKAALQQELQQVEAEQKQAAADLANAQSQSASLSKDISVLNAKIKTAQLNIKAKNLLIQTLGNDINIKQIHIVNLDAHIEKGKETLSQLLRKTNELDSSTLPELLLSQNTLTGFFQDADTFQSVEEGLKSTFEQLRSDKAETTAEKDALDARKNKETDARYAIEQDKKNVESNQSEKNKLLTVSKGNEKAYSTLLAQKQARAAQIRAALFSLRDASAIPFGQALQYATLASQKTGVRPALILAILTQESNLGANVGACYLTDQNTGAGIKAKSGIAIDSVMSPTRDVPPFLSILNSLGGDPTKTLVSCPLDIGWGGAMGPSQFIPSTWMLMKDRIASALGISGMPDPWNPGHAITATALYLEDRGAMSGSYTAEKNAACKYYSGKSCGLVKGNTAYGNSVMSLADNIQRNMIDPLQGL